MERRERPVWQAGAVTGCEGAAGRAEFRCSKHCWRLWKGVRSTLREAANQLSNKLSHAQHLDEVTWTTKNWHGLQMQRLSVVLHTAVAWQTVNELACGESGIVHGAECIAVLNGVA